MYKVEKITDTLIQRFVKFFAFIFNTNLPWLRKKSIFQNKNVIVFFDIVSLNNYDFKQNICPNLSDVCWHIVGL